MDAYAVVLFLHLLAVGIAFGATALIHSSFVRVRRAELIGPARDALALLARTSQAMPLIAIALFATGAYLTHARWSWRLPWVDVSIGALVLMQLIAVAILRPPLIGVQRALEGAADGSIPVAAAATIQSRGLWFAVRLPPSLAVGIMFVMVTKPGVVGGVAALLAASTVGVLSGGRPAASAGRAAATPSAADRGV